MKRRQSVLSRISNNKGLSGFGREVYMAVLDIPKGQTRSYKWVAIRIGRPKAARAVGNALNKNPYSGIVPCHRVIKSDRSIGGFASGPSRKKRMLRREGVDISTGSVSTLEPVEGLTSMRPGCYNQPVPSV